MFPMIKYVNQIRLFLKSNVVFQKVTNFFGFNAEKYIASFLIKGLIKVFFQYTEIL